MDEKIKQLAEVMLIQSQYFQNYIAKFCFATMVDYSSQATEIIEKKLIIDNPSQHVLYIVDVQDPHHYLKSILNQEVFPIPLFHHVWHNFGNVGSAQMYNTLLDKNLYLNLPATPMFNKFCFVLDGGRYSEEEETSIHHYDNMWTIYDEMLPPLGYLYQLNIDKIKIICDQKRNDLIVTCSNLYGDLVEIEVI